MLDVEVIAAPDGPAPLSPGEVVVLCEAALGAVGISEGHLAVEFVGAARIATLNGAHRGRPQPTDVLSFPIDGAEPAPGPRELGDVVICPAHTVDLREAVVHGALHLAGLDHEVDGGEMLALQRRVLASVCASR